MVRGLVATMLKTARGSISVENFADIFVKEIALLLIFLLRRKACSWKKCYIILVLNSTTLPIYTGAWFLHFIFV